jgi:CheY-like chemotaxis protein
MDGPKLVLDKVPFDLNEVLNACGSAFSPAVEQKGLKFQIFTDLNVSRYWRGDAACLKEVITNLLANALHGTTKGKIELRVCPEVGARGDKGLCFTVFSAAGSMPSEEAGQDLAVAQLVVEAMGGKMTLPRNVENGYESVFTVFPEPASERAMPSRGAEAESKSTSAGARILLVEDNVESMALLRSYLEDRSLVLDYATDGSEAVEKRRQHDYQLILMDIQMPVMDGLAATREIRAWEKEGGKARVPIVALTAYALYGAHAASIAAGCDAHLTKPVEQRELIEAIAKFAPSVSGGSEKVSQMVASRRPAFLANRRVDLEKMRAALAAGDLKLIQTIGHNCKGIGKGYGFPEISSIGAAIEQAAKALDAKRVEDNIQEFENSLATASEPSN